jgi:2-methylcitrate dehydratase PrpD
MDHNSSPSDRTACISADLSERLTELSTGWQNLRPEETRDSAERAFVDTIACAIAAQDEPAARIAQPALNPTSVSRIRGFPYAGEGTPQTIALLGGLAAHALDFDDVDDATISHPSAVLVPALLSLSTARDLSGEAVIDAYSRGVIAGRILAAGLGIRDHYELGWHSTSTIGTVAATVAVTRLLGLDARSVRHALGIAGSLAAGSRANFGTMSKPLHAGTAASNAILAALLAEGGFTSDTTQLEGPLGFLSLHSSGSDEEEAVRLEGPPAATAESVIAPIGLNIKAYPCCYYTHAAADAISDLVQTGLRAENVTAIEVCVQPGGLSPLIHHRPATGLQGKFSMEYVVAAMLIDSELTPQSFTDESVTRYAAQDLIPRIALFTSDAPPRGDAEWTDGYAVVTVTTNDGRTLTQRVDRPRGHACRPLDEVRLRAKFDSCLTYGGFTTSDSAYTALRGLSSQKSMRSFITDLEASIHSCERIPS